MGACGNTGGQLILRFQPLSAGSYKVCMRRIVGRRAGGVDSPFLPIGVQLGSGTAAPADALGGPGYSPGGLSSRRFERKPQACVILWGLIGLST